jgi:ferredoxin
MELLLEKIEAGHASEAEVGVLAQVPDMIAGNSLCALGDAAAGPVRSLVQSFRGEIDPPRQRRLPLSPPPLLRDRSLSPMPTVTINGRSVEVPVGTNVIEAAKKVGVQIPHYCYHPRLSIVGQCRMCLVQVDGQPKLQAGCSMTVQKDGMAVRTDVPEVEEGQRAMMEFLLINHPLDCPICDQAGECGLQDYAFKHGQAFSRFRFEEKRTYPGRERIPLGPNVLLNMNRCIQCTRCVRFTQEVSKTGSLGFFNRGARTEIGTFPGKELDDPLATNVVDICPVGALTSTRFRFAERVWYLDKKPSICTGCDVGCNVTLEHRRGAIRRYKPRANPEVNDFWLCDYGRSTHERYRDLPRLAAPRVGQERGGRPGGLAGGPRHGARSADLPLGRGRARLPRWPRLDHRGGLSAGSPGRPGGLAAPRGTRRRRSGADHPSAPGPDQRLRNRPEPPRR